jgi:hypothetical protein
VDRQKILREELIAVWPICLGYIPLNSMASPSDSRSLHEAGKIKGDVRENDETLSSIIFP